MHEHSQRTDTQKALRANSQTRRGPSRYRHPPRHGQRDAANTHTASRTGSTHAQLTDKRGGVRAAATPPMPTVPGGGNPTHLCCETEQRQWQAARLWLRARSRTHNSRTPRRTGGAIAPTSRHSHDTPAATMDNERDDALFTLAVLARCRAWVSLRVGRGACTHVVPTHRMA